VAIIACSHLGRPKGAPDPNYSLKPVAERLGDMLALEVALCPEVVGEEASAMAAGLRPQQIMVLENLRFEPGETKGDDELAAALAGLPASRTPLPADLAAQAAAAGQRAEWAADRHAEAVAAREKELDAVRARLGNVKAMLARQAELLEKLDREYQDYLAAQEAAARAAEEALSGGGGGGVGGGGGFVPPPNATKAQIAIAAARSVIGTRYVWGAADPNVGFDCSGLTSWAWARAGVSLPHSSAAQYSSLPRLPYSQAQPGDLLFFFNPVSHVGLYVGGGQMIHARHPGPGGQVQLASVSGYAQPVAAGRPA
jgi:cell wall-associated NlpC family hydrolase